MDNEVRPIDANALEKYSHPSVRGTYGYSAKAEDWMVSVGDIRNAPTLDYEPVRYGRWEPYDKPLTVDKIDGPVVENHTYYRCSLCKKGCYYKYSGTAYCPECGAKMIGEDEHEN